MGKFTTKSYLILGVLYILTHFCIIPVRAQCPNPRLYDLTFINPSSNPVWEHCIDNASDPDDFTLDLISPDNIENYTIDFGDGTTTSGAFWPANTPISHSYWLGQYTITVTETRNGCSRTITGTLINDRKAGAAAEPPTLGSSGCVPKSLTFKNISTNASPYTIFEWNWGDGTTEIQSASSVGKSITHTYQKGRAGCGMVVTLKAYSLCDTTFSSYGPYDFWDIDTAAIAASATTLCGPDTVTFTDVSNYNCNVTQPRRIRWDFRELGGPLTPWLAAIPANRVAKYYVSGPPGSTFTVFLEDSNYCGIDRSSISVSIVAPPVADVNTLYPEICAGENGVFTNNSSGGATIYRWNFGDGTGWRTIAGMGSQSYQYKTAGTYTVQLIAEKGGALCSDTDQVQINVLPAPITDFTLSKAGECGTVDVTFTDKSTGATSWNWLFSNGETRSGKGPWVLSFTPGTHQVQLTTGNTLGCPSSKTLAFTIYPEISVAMQADSVCLGNPTEFKDLSTLLAAVTCAKGSILREQWDNIGGATVSNLTSHPSYPASPSSSSLLTLFESANNIGNDFGARVRGFICPPQSGNYTFWIASDDESELWLSTDANPANKVRIAYVNGHTDPRQWTKYASQRSVSIYLEANQRYYIEALHKEGGGGDHLAVGWRLPSGTDQRPIPGTYLSPYEEGSTIQSWNWNFGDGIGTSDVKNPTYTYTSPGTYAVSLTVGTGKCTATGIYNVKVNPLTTADFNLSDTVKCTPFDLTLTNNSVNGAKYFWDMGDGTSEIIINGNSQNIIQHTFTNSGSVPKKYFIRLISETASGCKDTIIKSIRVLPGPIADFTFDPLSPKCSPVEITFTNNSKAGQNYDWYISNYDTITTNASTFKYTFTNTTGKLKEDTIRLVASANGCSGEVEKVVTVYPEAQFDIVATPDELCSPGSVSFSATGGAATFQWNFGDGTSSIFSTPVHSYENKTTKDTTYKVVLMAASAFNCKDTAYKDIVVHPKPTAGFSLDIKEGCSPVKVAFRNLSSNASSYNWDFGDGSTVASNSDSLVHTFINTDIFAKTFKVVLSVYNTQGCVDTISQNVLVYPVVQADFTVSDSMACSPKSILFSNKSVGASAYQWNFGDGSFSTEANPLHGYINTSTRDTTYLVKLIATGNTCSDTIEKSVTIYSLAQASFNVTPSGCSPMNASIINNSTNATKFTWDFGDGTTSIDTARLFSHTFTNGTFAPKLYTISLTAETDKGCKSVVTNNVTVHPGVNAVFALSDSVGCSPLNVKIQNYSTGATDYLWDFGNGSTSTSVNPSQNFTNSGSSDTTYLITLIARSSGCADTTVKAVVVNPKPVASFVSEGEGCSPFGVTFTNTSTPGATYNWSFGDGATSDTSAMSFVHVYTNLSNSNRVYPVNLVVKTSPGCTAVYNKTITVFAQVLADFAATDTVGCSPLKVAFTRLSSSGNKTRWDFGDGNQSNLTNPSHTFTNLTGNDTVYTVRLIVESPSCVDTAYQNITVHGVPKISFTSVAAGCSPLAVEFSNTSAGATNYTWNFGDGMMTDTNQSNIIHNFFNFGSSDKQYLVSLTGENAGGCRSTYSSAITVYPMINADFNASDTAGCSPYQVRFYNSSVPGVTYNYDFGDGESYIGSNPAHTFINTSIIDTIYQVRLIAKSANCVDTSYQSIRVYGKPKADFTVTDKGCSPVMATFNNLSIGASEYYWNFGDGTSSDTTALSFTHIMNNPGLSDRTYSITLIAENSNRCSAVVSKDILVYPKVTADFVLSDTAGCNPLKIAIQNYSFASSSYSWDFGNGTKSNLANPVITLTNSSLTDSVYTITLIASSETCSDTIQRTVTVHPSPKADIGLNVNEGCSPLSVSMTNASVGATTYQWDMGDGTVIDTIHTDINHVYVNSGFSSRTFRINLLAENNFGCQARTDKTVTVHPEVIAEFAVNDTVSCTPAFIQLANTSMGAKTYNWDFGNGTGSTLFSPSVTLKNSGTEDSIYTIRLVASSSTCKDTTYKTIRVHPAPKPSFIIPESGCGPLNATIQNTTTGAVRYLWDFGTGDLKDTSSAAPFNYVFYNNGISNRNYTVRLEAFNAYGCSEGISKTITVYPEVTADIIASDTAGCTPITIKFNKNSLAATNFDWSFGDGESANGSAVEHLFSNPVLSDTVYKVKLVAKSSTCADTAYKIITVYPAPKASFELPATGCSPFPASVNNTTIGAVTYFWDFGDGATSDTLVNSFSHLYYNINSSPRNYLVKLTATSLNGCSSVYNKGIIINPEVKADFIRDTLGCSPFNAAIQNRSMGATSYLWDFGDGSPKSDIASPFHLYETPADKIFNLTLIASSAYCADTITKTVNVLATPEARFVATPSSLTLPDSVVSINNLTTPGPWKYQWTFGDGDTSYVEEPGQHFYDFYGNYTITLKVSNGSCKSEYSQMIAVYPTAPVADFSGTGEGCSPLFVQFENKSKYADTLIWDFGDGDQLILARPFPKYISHTFLNPETYSVKLTAIGKGGSDQIIKDTVVKVRPVPYAAFSVKPREAVIPEDAHYFSNQSKDADSFEWDFGDGHTSTERSPFHTYEVAGEYDVKLIAHNKYGCSDTFFVKAAALATAGGVIKVPNAFTPGNSGPNGGFVNSGGLNDVFYPLTDNVTEFHMMIFNRWGELLYESKTVGVGWDGYYRGQLCAEDVYVYKIKATLSGGEIKELVGDVTLIRE